MTAAGRRVPTGTYRLQIRPGFGFAEAAEQVGYLDALGVSHVYLSPVLQAAPGSTHGYDVVDHSRLSAQAGGRPAFDALVDRLHGVGMGAVADVVPNHVALPTPAHLNAPLWSLLREGRESPFAHWFDVDWAAGDGRILMPVLGTPLAEVLAAGELSLAPDGGASRDEEVLRYHEHEFPLRRGTTGLPIAELVEAQWYRLASWRDGSESLNYRRFFDVSTLVAIRVEDPDVFLPTHALLGELVASGSLDGLRVDHPDGLADPRGYLRRLADATGGAWVVVEKILEGQERLPADWECAGTTGYDALMRVGGVFVDPAGAEPLADLLAEVTGQRVTLETVVREAKELVVASIQAAEVHRLVRILVSVCQTDVSLPGIPEDSLRRAVGALLVAMDRYRAYVVPGEPAPTESMRVVDAACERARARLDAGDHPALALVRDLALGLPEGRSHPEFVTRFQQTCGPVMAKGVEDTAFYRWFRLTALNEVGGDPDRVGVEPAELHAFARHLAAHWPTTMTTLSTHDTKRSEDVRGRLAAISERAEEWASWLRVARAAASVHRRPELDPATEYLLWQTLVGAWPISARRLSAYAHKAIREAKQHTTWAAPDEAYESAVQDFVTGVLGDETLVSHVQRWVADTGPLARATTLGQKLLQLALPGVPDVYQGTELVDLSLVDPDNRRDVDFAERAARLARLDAGEPPRDLGDEKLLVTWRALRLRREHPDWFTGPDAGYLPLPVTSRHALAVGRGPGDHVRAVAVVTRLLGSLEEDGGWAGHTVAVPAGRWRNVLTGDAHESAGSLDLVVLLTELPVALLVSIDG